MALNLIKLCVGVETIQELDDWIARRLADKKRLDQPVEHTHITRMAPKRVDELLSGGSLFWVIKGQIACRQKLLDLRVFTDGEGVGRCALVLEPIVIRVRPRPMRPFQGWRYLAVKDTPEDLFGGDAAIEDMPEPMRRELVSLGLL
jgi:hypothetical protein